MGRLRGQYLIFKAFLRNRFIRDVVSGLRTVLRDRTTRFFFAILVGILLLGIFGPVVAPYDYNESQFTDDGELKSTESPSLEHPLGTTSAGYDVLSRVLTGARPTMITGLLGGSIIITIGMTVGITAGYVGGWVENALMRLTDFVYGVPLIPFAIVLVTFMGVGFLTSILVIGLLLWRSSARVIRSQVLQIKEYPFIQASRATGASTPRIIVKHILPNVAPMGVLFFAIGVGYSILIQASLSFLGVTNPFVPSWGVMVRNAFNSGYMASAWWWSITPGVLIALVVVSTFMFGRSYESLTNTRSNTSVEEGTIG